MRQYHDLLRDILDNGIDKPDRTGTGARSVFVRQMRFDLLQGFPVLTTKKLHLRSIIGELIWFLRGGTNVRWLQEHGITIWDEWADENGDLGPVYGHQWRHFGGEYPLYWNRLQNQGVDQIANLLYGLRTNPNGRRHIVSAWNPVDVDKMALPPCHMMFQFYVRPARDGGLPLLDCSLYQRSCDTFLGIPFNIASYALLTMIVAQQVDMRPGEFIWTGGDVHLYSNHFDQARLQLSREPRPLPIMVIRRKPDDIGGYEIEDFELQGYDPHPGIKAPIAV